MHEPVMAAEVVSLLAPRGDGLYVDCTLGFGGHTAALIEAGAGRVIGIDRDPAALAFSRDRLAAFGDRVTYVHADYRELPDVLRASAVTVIDGALADLGVSSMQLDDAARGFSFRQDGPLDMRMDPTRGVPLCDRLIEVDEATLADVIFQFGEERHARRIARAIVQARATAPLDRTGQLASLVRRAAGGGTWQRLDPATRTFQALRIWVNDELTGLEGFLRSAVAALALGGRLVVIAFHSLEDRIVKRTFRALEHDAVDEGAAAGPRGRVLTRKPLMPAEAERERNPRARSARLRAVERVA
jgi:16S rRNA (cytosine1402-N4)-methyltransferase